ncbi:MAG TPA: nucleotidyltransferase domain-containing protein [Spirochaetota bacterium]|nr:nucleotidyltransferase domain-containing protein [Spirochaetota bacterium]
MKLQDENIAKEFKRRLKSEMEITDFRVFGSRADDTNDMDSDLDIYIQLRNYTKKKKYRIYEIAWEVSYEKGVVISPLVFSQKEVTTSPLRSSPILKKITRSGIVI